MVVNMRKEDRASLLGHIRIFEAIREDNFEQVKAILAENPSAVNAIAPKRPLDTRGMSPLQVSLCTGRHKKIAWLLLESGADVAMTDHYGRNCLMEAVAEANNLCPVKNRDTGEDYPGRPITPEMCEDLRRIFKLLIDADADRNNVSAYSKKSIREHYECESVWRICGDLREK